MTEPGAGRPASRPEWRVPIAVERAVARGSGRPWVASPRPMLPVISIWGSLARSRARPRRRRPAAPGRPGSSPRGRSGGSRPTRGRPGSSRRGSSAAAATRSRAGRCCAPSRRQIAHARSPDGASSQRDRQLELRSRQQALRPDLEAERPLGGRLARRAGRARSHRRSPRAVRAAKAASGSGRIAVRASGLTPMQGPVRSATGSRRPSNGSRISTQPPATSPRPSSRPRSQAA